MDNSRGMEWWIIESYPAEEENQLMVLSFEFILKTVKNIYAVNISHFKEAGFLLTLPMWNKYCDPLLQ